MILSTVIVALSFLLDGIMSLSQAFTLNNPSLMLTFYTIIALVIIYPYFDNDKKFFLLALIFGFLFDVTYTNTFILNTTMFFLLAIVIKIFNQFLSSNFLTSIIISGSVVIFYLIITYVIVTLVNYGTYPMFVLVRLLVGSIAMTIIYTIILYGITSFLYKKFNINHIK